MSTKRDFFKYSREYFCNGAHHRVKGKIYMTRLAQIYLCNIPQDKKYENMSILALKKENKLIIQNTNLRELTAHPCIYLICETFSRKIPH